MSKATKNQLKKVMSRAWDIYRAGVKNFKMCLRSAWKEIKQLAADIKKGFVTFCKKDDTVTTRRISTLENMNYEGKGGKSTNLIKLVDLDKLEATGDINQSIISFHFHQLMKTDLDRINAEIIYEEMEIPFEFKDCTLNRETNTITIILDTEYGYPKMSVQVLATDDCKSIEEKFKQLLAEEIDWLNERREYDLNTPSDWQEHGYSSEI